VILSKNHKQKLGNFESQSLSRAKAHA